MAAFGPQNVNRSLGFVHRKTRWEKGLGCLLPEAYKKFWNEWKVMKPVAVNYTPEEGRWKRNEVTGEINPVQNVPIPVQYPPQFDEGLWGGDGIVKGFKKKAYFSRRVTHFWIPPLKRSVVYSEVLNVYLSVIVTNRTINLIHENYGFDHYILKTPACDLKSVLALTIKRRILQGLLNKCPAYNDDPVKQNEVYEQYKKYLSSYSSEDIEWYGYTWQEAILKIAIIKEKQNQPKPLKQEYRSQLIEQLKAAGISELQDKPEGQLGWISKINPFAKKQET